MHCLFFLIEGQPDVDMCEFTIYNKTHDTAHQRVYFCTAASINVAHYKCTDYYYYYYYFTKITITQLCKPMTSQFNNRLRQNNDRFK